MSEKNDIHLGVNGDLKLMYIAALTKDLARILRYLKF